MKWEKILPYIVILLLVGTLYFLKNGGGATIGSSSNVPDYAIETLQIIRETGKAPRGYVGGRTFQNREKLLPKKGGNGQKLKYKEWDVHPKVKGRNRGAERLVTGSDKSAYYTSDHYRSFTKIEDQ